MIDKPVPAKILLTLADDKAKGAEFIGLPFAMYKQNLIFSEPREIRVHRNIVEVIVVFRDISSFKHWNKYIIKNEYWFGKFNQLLVEKPKTVREKDVILEADNIKNCTCGKSKFYILQGRSLRFADELTCNNCLGQITYAKIPLEIDIEDWQTKHERVYLNWLESGLFEKEAFKELTNYRKGKLNLAGERIRKQLSAFFKIPVYISYFKEQPDDNQTCLVCGRQGVHSGLRRPKRICKTCNTIFG